MDRPLGKGFGGKVKRFFFVAIFCFTVIQLNFVLGQSYARYPGSFLRMGATARSVSLGGALTVDSYQGLAGLYNPAGAAFIEKGCGTAGYQILSQDRQLSSIGIAVRLPPTAGVGLAWIHAGVKNIEERDSFGEYTGRLSVGENAFVLSFAQSLRGIFAFGINVKIMTQSLPIYGEDLMGTAVGMDFGFLYKMSDFIQLGGVVQNLSAKYKWKTNAIFQESGTIYYENFPVIYKLGLKSKFDDFNILLEAEYFTHDSLLLGSRLNGGIEYLLNESISLRSGLGQGRFGIGFGLSYHILNKYWITLDYSAAIKTESNVDGLTHVLSSSISF